MRVSYLGSTVLIGMFSGASIAVPIVVNNPSFEDPGAGPVPGWNASPPPIPPATGGLGVYAPYTPTTTPPGTTYTSIPDGTQVAYLYNSGMYIYQTTLQALTPGRVYDLSAYFGERSDTYQPRTIMTLLPESEIADFVASPFGGGTDHLAFVQVEPENVAPGQFGQFGLTFDTNSPANAALVAQYAGQKLVITFYEAGGGETDIDKVDFSYIPSGPTHWNVNGSGDWNDDTKWNEGIPNGVDQPANFLGIITGPQTVYTNTAVTVGALNFDNANSYQITGQGSLTLQVSTGNASVSVAQGAHKLNLPTYFASDTTLTVAGGATLTLSDPVVIRANKTVTRGGNVVIEAPLTIEAGGVYNVGAGPAAVVFGAPSLASGAKVNVGNNALVIDYRGQASPAATIKAQLISGRNNGAWNGEGISTTSGTATTGLGWVDSPGTQSVLVKYTYNGDANLDGTVNSNDFNALVAAYGATSGAIWAQGDFDYDGKINTKDFNFLAGNFGLTIPAPASLGSVVPEPASFAVVGMFAFGSLAMRVRKTSR